MHKMASREAPVFLVDLNNVLADFDGGVENELEQNHPEIAIVRPRAHFYIHEDYPKEHHEAIKKIWQAPGFFRGLKMVDGAINGWQQLIEEGVHPRICSSPPLPTQDCIQEGKDWLEEYMVHDLGTSVLDEAIFDKDKSRHEGRALIDDKAEVTGAKDATWSHIVFDAPYNQDASTTLRLYSWRDSGLPNLVKKILAKTNG